MKKIFFLIVLLIPTIQFAQNNYVLEYSHTNSNDFTCKSYLYSNDKECLYKIGDNRPSGEIVTKTSGVGFLTNDEMSEFFYSTNNMSYHRFLYDNLEWFYTDQLENKLNWTINNNKKKTINQYYCTEAKLKINGRNYTVWFTYDVPFKYGPLKLHNLPGLIVEVTEDTNFLKITLTSYKKIKTLNEFSNYKKYIANWKNMSDYQVFTNDLSKHQISLKLKALAFAKEMKSDDTSFYSDEYAFNYFLDVPNNLLESLKKMR